MALPRRVRFVFGASDFSTNLPARAWVPADETVGGARIAASGVPATYIVRRDDLLTLVLRFEESEWEDVRDLVVFGQSGQTLRWFPDADDAANVPVYLQTPAPGERWAPTRDGQYPRVFEVTLTLRAAGTAPWLPYFTT